MPDIAQTLAIKIDITIGQSPALAFTGEGSIFGENTPIEQQSTVYIKGETFPRPFGSMQPWIDESKLIYAFYQYEPSFTLNQAGNLKLIELEISDKGAPYFPAGHTVTTSSVPFMRTGVRFDGFASLDEIGVYDVVTNDSSNVTLNVTGSGTQSVGSKVSGVIPLTYGDEADVSPTLRFSLYYRDEAPDGAVVANIYKVQDRDGNALTNRTDAAAGLTTSEEFRRSAYGVDEFRLMHDTGTNTASANVIRYDQLAGLDYADYSIDGANYIMKSYITGVTLGNPTVITFAKAHSFAVNDRVEIERLDGNLGGQFNSSESGPSNYLITAITATTITLNFDTSTGYDAYTSGGVAWRNTAPTELQDLTRTATNPGATFGHSKIGKNGAVTLRAAWEVGAYYHHNFSNYCFQNLADINDNYATALPAEWTSETSTLTLGQAFLNSMGEWALTSDKLNGLWVDSNVPQAVRDAQFNATEFDHIDAFGADMLDNRAYVRDGRILVEHANEPWNSSGSVFNRNFTYMRRWGALMAALNGRADPNDSASGVFYDSGQGWYVMDGMRATGYAITKAVARLRKRYPEFQWVGIMACKTNDESNFNPQGPEVGLAGGYYNISLRQMLLGYEDFWTDYDANPSWASEYAPQPASPGDWFQVNGTTYYYFSLTRNSANSLGGIAPAELQTRAADGLANGGASSTEWRDLAIAIRDAFIHLDNPDLAGGASPILTEEEAADANFGMPRYRRTFRALAEHAAAYGMQTGSYEGGNHGNYGADNLSGGLPSAELHAFWDWFQQSIYIAECQQAVHDEAVSAGWISLADFDMYGLTPNGPTDDPAFGTRRAWDEASPRYAEYVNRMAGAPGGSRTSESLPSVQGNVANLKTPYARCGTALLDHLRNASANSYYRGLADPGNLLPDTATSRLKDPV